MGAKINTIQDYVLIWGDERSSPIIIGNALDVVFLPPQQRGSHGEAKTGCPIEKATTETQGKVLIKVSKKDKQNSCKDIVPGI